jgi:4'-phosphopantetheinyl transferase
MNDDEVHIWRAALDTDPEHRGAFAATLAPEERTRAGRFHRPIDRDRFIVAHGLLRAIIARYLDRDPGAIAFQQGPSGKPSLRDDVGDHDLHFNMSHADGIALYALARDCEVGVDVERVRAGFADERIAERFFSRCELATLRALPPEQQRDAFFHCWTRKEAFVKARGTGIATALDSFDVSLSPDEPAAILAIREVGEPHPWSLHHLDPGPHYVGAVAVEGAHPARTYRQWQMP